MKQLGWLSGVLWIVGIVLTPVKSAGVDPRSANPEVRPSDQHAPAGHPDLILIRALPTQFESIALRYGLTQRESFLDGEDQLVLAQGPAGLSAAQLVAWLQGDPEVRGVEPAILAALPEISVGQGASLSQVLPDLRRSGTVAAACPGTTQWASLWSGFADQRAATLIHLAQAQQESIDCGAAATIAIIDTAVDGDHPLLAPALLPGFDFLLHRVGMPEDLEGLDQSVMAILESGDETEVLAGHGDGVLLGPSTALFLEPSLATSLADLDLPPFFGHGTMVAGLIRLTAPNATILPLRVFDAAGHARLFDVIQAIYLAVDQGVDVINMSFSVAAFSPELQRAIHYASQHGVACVAAAGNQGERVRVYPAAMNHAIGVAATDLNDQLSEFSNYGPSLVTVAAPGVAVVSTFPDGHFAAGWGTSFSTPLVAGTLALIQAYLPTHNPPTLQQKLHALAQGSLRLEALGNEVGSGRLDALAVVRAAQR